MMKRRLIALSVLLAAALAIATGIYLGKLRSTEDFLNELRAPTGPVGFCVHLGAGDGALTVELAAGDRLAVHALESDAEKAGRARKRLESLDLYGRAAVEPWTARWLPYADNLVNVLAAETRPGFPSTR
ncbi:MAG: hypothetical protein HZA91_03890 [Verrucomicrobia bacterium]|nr:hypothetical protein [Verrucomicrobiota bacterium]